MKDYPMNGSIDGTEITAIREELVHATVQDSGAVNVPDELFEAVAKNIYALDPVYDSGESIDGFQVSPAGPLSWEALIESGDESTLDHFRSMASAAIYTFLDHTPNGSLTAPESQRSHEPSLLSQRDELREALEASIDALEKIAQHMPETKGLHFESHEQLVRSAAGIASLTLSLLRKHHPAALSRVSKASPDEVGTT